jgi:heme iron utilization protein
MTEMTLQDSSGNSGLFVTSARYLMRGTGVGSLATLEPVSGSPYASMITVATETDGTPLLLISRLAWHTRNLETDPRASILFMSGGSAADPLALGRISVMGRAERTDSPAARARFLARHPEAEVYIDFADFALWRLTVEMGHFIGGFGRIGTIAGDRLIRNVQMSRAWDDGIASQLDAINAGDAALLARLAEQHDETGQGRRLAACDPEGAELVADGRALRLVFPEPLESVYQIPEALQRLAGNNGTSH